MSLLAHHLKKDIRHLRWLLVLWALLVFGQFVLVGLGNRADPNNVVAQVAYQVVVIFLPLLQGVLVLVMIPILIHDEPQVGTTAFWFTRPIPRRLLLTSKAVFVSLAFIVFPAVIELVVMAANNVPLGDLVGVAPEILFGWLRWTVPVFALAALTLNFARFAITGVSLYIGISVSFVGLYLASLYFRGIESSVEVPYSLSLSRSIVTGGVAIAMCGLITGVQYLTRRTPLSISLAGITLLGLLLLNTWWPLDFMSLPMTPPPQAEVDCSALTVEPSTSHGYGTPSNRGAKEPVMRITSALDVKGLPPGYVAQVQNVRSEFVVDGKSVAAGTNRSFSSYNQRRWEKNQIESLFSGMRIIGEDSVSVASGRLFSMPMNAYLEVRNASGLLRGDADVLIQRLNADHPLALERGSRFRDGALLEVIADVNTASGGAVVVLRRSSLNRTYARTHGPRNFVQPTEDRANAYYVLVNTERGEVVMADQNYDFDPELFMGAGSRLSVKRIYLRFTRQNRDASWDADFELTQDWLDGAKLVRLSRTTIGACTLPFSAEDFMLTKDGADETFSLPPKHRHRKN